MDNNIYEAERFAEKVCNGMPTRADTKEKALAILEDIAKQFREKGWTVFSFSSKKDMYDLSIFIHVKNDARVLKEVALNPRVSVD